MPEELKPHDILAGSSWKDLECATLFRKSGQIGNKPFKNSHLFRKTGQIGNKLMAPAIIRPAACRARIRQKVQDNFVVQFWMYYDMNTHYLAHSEFGQ